MRLSLLPLLFSPLCLAAATKTPHEELIALAESNHGIIKLNSQTWDLLTAPKRDWSAVVQLTALNQNMKCAPCRYFIPFILFLSLLTYRQREFDPTFRTVAKAWATVSKAERNKHFFASLDFQDGQDIFKKVLSLWYSRET